MLLTLAATNIRNLPALEAICSLPRINHSKQAEPEDPPPQLGLWSNSLDYDSFLKTTRTGIANPKQLLYDKQGRVLIVSLELQKGEGKHEELK